MHGTHLRSVRFMGFTLDPDGLENLMEECEGVEKLAISVPADDIVSNAGSVNVFSGWTRSTVRVFIRAGWQHHIAYPH
jgi:hypothetical protein